MTFFTYMFVLFQDFHTQNGLFQSSEFNNDNNGDIPGRA